jgi:hypothetical protein
MYKMLTAVVLPRPIAWVSTTSGRGVDNLAPHSFFTVASANPPIVQFTSVGRKDSVTNAEATGEFVVNFAPEALQPEINATATDFPAIVAQVDLRALITDALDGEIPAEAVHDLGTVTRVDLGPARTAGGGGFVRRPSGVLDISAIKRRAVRRS